MASNLKLYGFEDYNVFCLRTCILSYSTLDTWDISPQYTSKAFLLIPSSEMSKYYKKDDYCASYSICDNLCSDHKKLLTTAKKVFVHPSCKLSRTLISTKYKKVLNPWQADAIVIPEVNRIEIYFQESYSFINEKSKTIYIIEGGYLPESFKRTYPSGTHLKDAVIDKGSYLLNNTMYSWQDALESEIFYQGPIMSFDGGSKAILDLLTNSLPKDKTVYESTVQESLGGEDNKITFDALTSIADMLRSSDEDTVGAAFKTLSMMDYMHYTNSVKYVLSFCNFYSIRCNRATKSTSVRFMLNQLLNGYRYLNYDDTIYQEDYNLLRQLVAHFNKLKDNAEVNKEILGYPFIVVDNNGFLAPNIRKSA